MERKRIGGMTALALLAAYVFYEKAETVRAGAMETAIPTGMVSLCPEAAPKKEYKTVTFSVSMHCHNCVKKLNENLPFEKGVKSLDVSLETKTVKITYDPAKTDVSALQKAIEKLGYAAKAVR